MADLHRRLLDVLTGWDGITREQTYYGKSKKAKLRKRGRVKLNKIIRNFLKKELNNLIKE